MKKSLKAISTMLSAALVLSMAATVTVTAFAEDSKVLAEETIIGRELEVSVLGNEDPAVSCIGEIFSAGEFYDYESKYVDEASRTAVVTDLSREKEEEIRQTALRVYRILECRGLARVDFFLREDGRVVFNEVNTMPGFTHISMYPSLWEASGLSYGALIDALLGLAAGSASASPQRAESRAEHRHPHHKVLWSSPGGHRIRYRYPLACCL